MRWPSATAATIVLAGVVVFAAACAPAAEQPGQQVIRQGGYTEKVQPGVDYKDRLPRIPPRSAAESLEAFHLVPGMRIELAAAEPLVRDAVDMAFDERGRMYVAEMIPYAEGGTSKFGSPGGRVSLLEDLDGDGRFDRGTVFADRLVWPTAVACFDGGVFIAAAPELLYCKDTDGDGRADLREVVLTGFATSNPNALPNSLRWGLDNRIHGMTSTAGGALRAVRWAAGEEGRPDEPVQARGRDFSIHPRTGQLRLESGGGQYGMTFDAWGRKFESSNSTPIEMVMYDDRYIARNPYLVAPSPRERIWEHGMTVFRTSPVEPWRVVRTEMRIGKVFSGPVEGGGKPAGYFTAACGLFIYAGDAWPAEMQGSALVCEGAGNLVHRMRLQPAGIGFSAHRTEQNHEFLTSDDVWFRPIQFAEAPDGALYLADMYRECFEHPDAVPPSVKKYLDLTSGNDRGRIYRLVPEGFERPKPPRLDRTSTSQLVGLLEHPNRWHRRTAGRLLYERKNHGAIAPLAELAAGSESPLARMHAMYALSGLEALDADAVLQSLDDEHPRVREHAVRLAEEVLANAPAVREKLYSMAGDEDLRVRYQLAFTLGEIPSGRATAALAEIAARDAAEPWMRLAVLSSCYGRSGELLSRLAERREDVSAADVKLWEDLAYQAGRQDRADQVADVLAVLERLAGEGAPAAAVVRGLDRGLAQANSPLRSQLSAQGGTRAGQLLANMVEQAKRRAADADLPVEQRVEAAGSLALASWADAGKTLGRLLDGRQPQAVQRAALRALGRHRRAEVAAMVTAAWPGFSPQVRAEAAEVLFARRERLPELLMADRDGRILPSQLDPARIRMLTSHPDREIRDNSAKLFDTAGLARRDEVVAAHRDVLEMAGDVARGREAFKKHCATCHRLEGVGYDLGLPLAATRNRGEEFILLNVLDPNREVNPQYLNYVVVTDDGRSATGMIAAETATSITLKRADGERDTVLRAEIDELQSTGLSIMPEGLEKQLTRQELADVISYIMAVQ